MLGFGILKKQLIIQPNANSIERMKIEPEGRGANITALQAKILNRIQMDFPLCEDPYRVLADSLGCAREQALEAIRALRRAGVIRRIGGVFDAAKLGFQSCLVAARVDSSKIEPAAKRVSAYPEVTHNYERDGIFNLWFTIIAAGVERRDEILNDLRACEGVREAHVLPSNKVFKIKVDFKIEDKNDDD